MIVLPFLLIFATFLNAEDSSKCGRTTLSEPLKGGHASMREFPHMCTMFIEYRGDNVFAGGASLISDNKVLTLASGVVRFLEKGSVGGCNQDSIKYALIVSCGSENLQAFNDDNQQRRQVVKIKVHPEYNAKTLVNDMAILITEKPFTFNDYIGPVCLPQPGSSLGATDSCVATGHGKNYDEGGFYSKKLLKTSKMPIWSKEACEKTLNELHFEKLEDVSIKWRADESFLCAGGEIDNDTCEGDGGGPLVCIKSDSPVPSLPTVSDPIFDEDPVFDYDSELDLRTAGGKVSLVQEGIVAWGVSCGQEGFPSVYTRVSSGRCWIDQIMTCYQKDQENELDLRGTSSANNPMSVGGLTQDQCGDWLQSAASDTAACGCKQTLLDDNEESDIEEDLDLRGSELGLRTASS